MSCALVVPYVYQYDVQTYIDNKSIYLYTIACEVWNLRLHHLESRELFAHARLQPRARGLRLLFFGALATLVELFVLFHRFPFVMSKNTGVTVKDVCPHAFNKAFAAFLKK